MVVFHHLFSPFDPQWILKLIYFNLFVLVQTIFFPHSIRSGYWNITITPHGLFLVDFFPHSIRSGYWNSPSMATQRTSARLFSPFDPQWILKHRMDNEELFSWLERLFSPFDPQWILKRPPSDSGLGYTQLFSPFDPQWILKQCNRFRMSLSEMALFSPFDPQWILKLAWSPWQP